MYTVVLRKLLQKTSRARSRFSRLRKRRPVVAATVPKMVAVCRHACMHIRYIIDHSGCVAPNPSVTLRLHPRSAPSLLHLALLFAIRVDLVPHATTTFPSHQTFLPPKDPEMLSGHHESRLFRPTIILMQTRLPRPFSLHTRPMSEFGNPLANETRIASLDLSDSAPPYSSYVPPNRRKTALSDKYRSHFPCFHLLHVHLSFRRYLVFPILSRRVVRANRHDGVFVTLPAFALSGFFQYHHRSAIPG